MFGFLSKLLAPWWGITFQNSRQIHCFILCLNYMMFPLVCSPIPRNVYCLICDNRRVFVDRYRMICLVLDTTRGGPLRILGHKLKDQVYFWHTNHLNRVDMLQSTIWVQVWNLMLKLLTRRGASPFFWLWVSMSRSTAVLCLWKLLGTIQTSFVQSLSNSTHKLLMIRGGVLLICSLGQRVRSTWDPIGETVWALCRLQFFVRSLPITSQG